nr:unnamed protein product [Callosobruchus analis]
MYNALIESILKYCITIWGGAFSTTLNNLQRPQSTLLKIIYHKIKLSSTELLYHETQVFRIKHIYVYQCLLKMYSKQDSFKKLSTVPRATTNFNLGVHFFKKTLTQKTFLYHGPNFFNILSADLKCIKKFNQYKNKIKSFIIKYQEKFKF